jgi:hypothetical protein
VILLLSRHSSPVRKPPCKHLARSHIEDRSCLNHEQKKKTKEDIISTLAGLEPTPPKGIDF